MSAKRPNVIFMLTDQWRLHALGYAGNAQVQTPHIDRLASESINFTHATAGYPVCSPWRASFLTGQYPLTHGVVVNDVPIRSDPVGLGDAFKAGGYDTAYIGKWHVNGQGRSNYIPPERRLGFDYFKALECTHDYNHSAYYAGDSTEKLVWDGYDVLAQTTDAQQYIQRHPGEKPFLLVLSWGPPHNPYETAPLEFRQWYDPNTIELRPNVPGHMAEEARQWLAGYYAHCSAIDQCVGNIMDTLETTGIAEDTILIFTSDHGDMLGSHGLERKQKPYEESIRVPFLVHYPREYGRTGQTVNAFLNAHDIMPTLLGLCGLPIPATVQGLDFSPVLAGGADHSGGAALLACFHPFGEWSRDHGGREFRGVRTARYTYCRTLEGPWLLYDNWEDPYQLENRITDERYVGIRDVLEQELQRKLLEMDDTFEEGMTYIRQWGYPLDETGTVPYTW